MFCSLFSFVFYGVYNINPKSCFPDLFSDYSPKFILRFFILKDMVVGLTSFGLKLLTYDFCPDSKETCPNTLGSSFLDLFSEILTAVSFCSLKTLAKLFSTPFFSFYSSLILKCKCCISCNNPLFFSAKFKLSSLNNKSCFCKA